MTTTQTAHIKLSFSSPAGSFAPLVTKLGGVDQWDDTKSVCNVQGVSPVTSTPVPQMTRQHLVRCFTAAILVSRPRGVVLNSTEIKLEDCRVVPSTLGWLPGVAYTTIDQFG